MTVHTRTFTASSGWTPGVALTLLVAILCHTLPSLATQRASGPASSRLVVLAPFEHDLLERIRGQLAGSHWDVRLETSGAERAASVARAFAAARKHKAHAVLWVGAGRGDVLELRLLDVAGSGLVERDVPWTTKAKTGDASRAPPPDDPLARSAAYETAALIVRSTLTSIEQGTPVGETVQAPESKSPEPFSRPPEVEDAAGDSGTSHGGVRPRLGLTWRAYLDQQRVRHGPALALGAASDWLWAEAFGVWSLAQRVSARPEGSAATTTRADFELSELGGGLAFGWVVVERASWQIEVGVASALILARRRTTSTSDDLSPAEESRALGVEITALWRLLSPPLFQTPLRLAGEVGVATYARRPHWVLEGPEGERPLNVGWRPVQPWAALGFAASF